MGGKRDKGLVIDRFDPGRRYGEGGSDPVSPTLVMEGDVVLCVSDQSLVVGL